MVADPHRHDVAVDDVGELVAVSDDVNLVPLAQVDELHERVAIAEGADRAGPLAVLRSDDMAAPDDLRVGATGAGILDVAVVSRIVVPVQPVSTRAPFRIGWHRWRCWLGTRGRRRATSCTARGRGTAGRH